MPFHGRDRGLASASSTDDDDAPPFDNEPLDDALVEEPAFDDTPFDDAPFDDDRRTDAEALWEPIASRGLKRLSVLRPMPFTFSSWVSRVNG